MDSLPDRERRGQRAGPQRHVPTAPDPLQAVANLKHSGRRFSHMCRLRQAMPAAALLAGTGLLVAIFSKVGPGAISQALAPVGWNIVPIILCHGFPMLCDTLGWRLLFLGHRRPSLYMLTRARWIGEAINSLLPVAHIGGELVRVRLAALAGSKPIHAAASVLADITLGAATQILFGLSGIILLAATYERISMLPIIIGLGIAACSITALLSLKGQRSIAAISRSAQRFLLIPRWARGFGGVGEFRGALVAICGSGHVLSLACSWRLVGWFAGTGEIFLSLHFLGHAATWTDAIILESIVQLSRSLAFAIPGGIGIQEASFVAVGGLLGLGPTMGLALALIRRASTVALGLPALAVYWFVEARRAVAVASR